MDITSDTIGAELRAGPGDRLGDCDPGKVRDLLVEKGWVYFSGFSPSTEEFESFTAQFGTCAPTRTVHYPPGGVALGFHAEDAYNPYRPDALWFFCLAEGSHGGKPTGVVDGVRLLGEMDAGWARFCRENGLRFDRRWPATTWQRALGRDARPELDALLSRLPGVTYEFLEDDSLYVRSDSPFVVRTPAGDESFSNTLCHAITEPSFYGMTLTDGSPVPMELVEVVQEAALDTEIPVGWSTGDTVVVDNFRMMHRRGEYPGKGRDLRVRHAEDLFGSDVPDAASPVAAWVKCLLQGEVEHPIPLDAAVASRAR